MMKTFGAYAILIAGALFIGYGSNWKIGVGSFILAWGMLMFVQEYHRSAMRSLVFVNNNLASPNPKANAVFKE